MGCTQQEVAALEQMTFPGRHGGLCPAPHQSAQMLRSYVIAAVQKKYAIASGPTESKPFEGLSDERLRLMWEGLDDAGGGLWPPAERMVGEISYSIWLVHNERTAAMWPPSAIPLCSSPTTL
jgi:hypothetical protein